MKKISFIFVLMTLFFGLFNSCELDDDDFIGPKNKWCYKEFQYTDEEGKSSFVDCYFLYSDGTYSPSSTLVDNTKFDFTVEGLTVVAIPRLDSPLYSTLGNNKYVVKTLELEKNIMMMEKKMFLENSLCILPFGLQFAF